ncbi:MAG: response regulator [Sulfurimonas sp.]|nr:response regulator [Sulfurimonas sp.]
MKLMIVDDSVIIRKAIQKYSAKYNLELVGLASDGKMALELFSQTLPDIVTLDITMPEVNGLVVLETMIKIKPEIKVIVISAQSDKSTALEALEKGAADFIGKPFGEEKLDIVLQRIIEELQ